MDSFQPAVYTHFHRNFRGNLYCGVGYCCNLHKNHSEKAEQKAVVKKELHPEKDGALKLIS